MYWLHLNTKKKTVSVEKVLIYKYSIEREAVYQATQNSTKLLSGFKLCEIFFPILSVNKNM